jgi:hypothetical protein
MKYASARKTNIRMKKSSLSFVLLFLIFITHPLAAQTPLGIHFTQEELDIWRKRANDGPYKTISDVSSNSPGDWNRIIEGKRRFMANPSAYRYKGPPITGECIQKTTQHSPQGYEPTQGGISNLLQAAFYYLVKKDGEGRAADARDAGNAVVKELVAQAQEKGVDLSNRQRWCIRAIGEQGPAFTLANMLTEYLYAYDYTKDLVNQEQKKILDKWFMDCAVWMKDNVTASLENYFPKRSTEYPDFPYTLTTTNNLANTPQFSSQLTHFNGNKVGTISRHYNNKRVTLARFAALAGVFYKNEELKKVGRMYFEETFVYGVYPDNVMNELYRWQNDKPNLGLNYELNTLGALITIADAFARQGDLSLYSFVTSKGIHGTQGGSKGLFTTMIDAANMYTGETKRYATLDASRNGDPDYLMDGTNIGNASKGLVAYLSVHDIFLAQANVYYRNKEITEAYTRRHPTSQPYPANPSYNAHNSVYEGEQGTYPAALFMFGQMEGKVWPYPNTAAVTSFTLIDAETNKAIGVIQAEDTIRPAGKAINIRADLSVTTADSVIFELNDQTYTRKTAPFAIGGTEAPVNPRDFKPFAIQPGRYTLKATPYVTINRRSVAGNSSSISFTLLNEDTTEWQVYPNPFTTTLVLRSSAGGSVDVQLSDALGRICYRKQHQVRNETLEIHLTAPELAAGVYFLKIEDRSGTPQVLKLVKQ